MKNFKDFLVEHNEKVTTDKKHKKKGKLAESIIVEAKVPKEYEGSSDWESETYMIQQHLKGPQMDWAKETDANFGGKTVRLLKKAIDAFEDFESAVYDAAEEE